MGIVLKRFAERVGGGGGIKNVWGRGGTRQAVQAHGRVGSGRMDACSLGTTTKERREAKVRYGRGGSDTGKG